MSRYAIVALFVAIWSMCQWPGQIFHHLIDLVMKQAVFIDFINVIVIFYVPYDAESVQIRCDVQAPPVKL